MPPLKKIDKETKCDDWNFRRRFLSMFIMMSGPLFLVYINVRCEKNQCVLLHFPLVFPTHLSAYFSLFSCLVIAIFIAFMFVANNLTIPEHQKRGRPKDISAGMSATLGSLLFLSILIVCTAYLKPEYIKLIRSEYLRMLCGSIAFCFIFSLVLALLIKADQIRQEKDLSFPAGFFYGYNTKLRIGSVNLKYFFYINVGLVAWGLLDLLIFVSFVLERPVTAPLCFVFITQYVVILHTLVYEKFLTDRPFLHTEGLGFFWLMRVLLFMPFLFTLPVLYTSNTEIVIPKPAMLANCGLFMFGFVIYISSLHQKENFVASLTSSRVLKSILTNSGRRLLVSGYWGTVQKPDYLGYMIIWFSWIVACGFSAISLVVLVIVYGTIFYWLYQRSCFFKERYGQAWLRYTSLVPHKIIPLVY